MAKELWEIKYRPKSIDQYVFQNEKHRTVVTKFIEEQSIPHLLLNGHRGTGKTSLAMVLKNELKIDDSDFMVINASDENNVDTMRNKIKGFISTYAMSQFKLVLLDEADYLSQPAQALLRNMMEEYADNARFILSCNKGNKIIPELKSRCFELGFKEMDKESMFERLVDILGDEGIKANKKTLNAYIELSYPDLRKAIQLMQSNIADGTLQQPSEASAATEFNIEIVHLMEADKYASIREVLATGIGDDDWEQLYRFLYDFLQDIGKFKDERLWKSGIIILADHLYRHNTVADPEINAMAMFLRLGELK